MGDKKQPENKSRRSFLSMFFGEQPAAQKGEMIKMLTADGKLVEVSKEMLDQAKNRFKATNKDIFNWMENPSKNNNQ